MGNEEPPVTVYKVGGSLFDMPDLFPRLNLLFASEQTWPLVVSGGGAAADVVREWDRVHSLGENQSHRLAIQSLALGSAFLADRLRGRIVSDRQAAHAAWHARQIAVLDVARFLDSEVADGAVPLPASWDVTSDSIAAWVAARWPAKLALVKSASPDRVQAPYVDRYFAEASAALKQVDWINLRDCERGSMSFTSSATSRSTSHCEKAGI